VENTTYSGGEDARLKTPIPRSLKSLDRWLADGHGGDLIPDRSSLDWFIKKHRDHLIRSSALFPGRGRRPSVVGPNFDRVVADLLGAESLATLVDPDQLTLPIDGGASQ